MNKLKLAKRIGYLRSYYHKNINNTYIWNSIVMDSLIAIKNNESILLKNNFKVVSKNSKEKIINRNNNDIINIFEKVISNELYSVMLTYIVAQVEAFFSDFITAYLEYDNKNLNILIKDGIIVNKDYNIKNQSIGEIITSRISKILYSSPNLQIEYMNTVSGIEIPELFYNNWIEIKATRDLIIHNQGIINNLYMRKVPPDIVRGKIGDKIIMNENYFNNSVGLSKSLVGRICSLSQNQLRKK